MGINLCPTGFSLVPRVLAAVWFLIRLSPLTTRLRAREAVCRVELVPTSRRAIPGLERMGQQHIQHYRHPTDHYRHQQDTLTAHILPVQVCSRALRFWIYALLV